MGGLDEHFQSAALLGLGASTYPRGAQMQQIQQMQTQQLFISLGLLTAALGDFPP